MIGMIVTGHGNFASGLTSGLKLLAGETEYYEKVDFEEQDSNDILTEKLQEAMERLADCEAIAIFADLTGGTPFNVAVRIREEGAMLPLEVAGGTNLPVVLQAYLSRTRFTGVTALVDHALEAGKGQLVRFVPE